MSAKESMDKTRLGLAGEFAVASELLKRGKDVNLTLGNAKAVDLFVYDSNGGIKTVEVKTSRNKRFVTNFFQKYPTSGTGSTMTQDNYYLYRKRKN